MSGHPQGDGRADYLLLGDWNAVCYQCGRKRKASTLKKHWQGYYVCPEHWETRQPQDFVRSVNDTQAPPWVQPMPANQFAVSSLLCTENSDTSVTGQGTPMSYICTETLYPLETET